MPRQPKEVPISREPGEVARDLENYLVRILPQWNQQSWYQAEFWRNFVQQQPIATICRETLIANLLALDWAIVARDSEQSDELKSEIQYYTKLFSVGYDGIDFTSHVEWLCKDLLDLPFGGASEVGRKGDLPSGKVLWIHNIDGSTLFPTLNYDFPVGQRVEGSGLNPIFFPKHAISRIYISPRTELRLEGWGMPPPEKIYLAINLLSRGDQYYANLLLDTPAAGILDLGDMEQKAAMDWIAGFRTLLQGVEAFKIPVLYEHDGEAKFLPFGKPPADLMFDKITTRYASIVASGYGMTLGDIGISDNANNTLAGSIREERKTKRTGFAVIKKKVKSYFDYILPDALVFKWIDYDDELNVSLGRSRLANAQAFNTLINSKIITPEESRRQIVADGLITISIPEEIDLSQFPVNKVPTPESAYPDSRDNLGRPVPPSMGGQGEVRPPITKSTAGHQVLQNFFREKFREILKVNNVEARMTKLVRAGLVGLFKNFDLAVDEIVSKSATPDITLNIWNDWCDQVIVDKSSPDYDLVARNVIDLKNFIGESLGTQDWLQLEHDADDDRALYFAVMSIYTDYVNKFLSELSTDLFVKNITEDFLYSGEVSITNQDVRDRLKKYSSKLFDTIDEGTKYYLSLVMVSLIRRSVTNKLLQARLSGTDIDIKSILMDNGFINGLVNDILTEFGLALEKRTDVIAAFEDFGLDRQAKLDVYRNSGLLSKMWRCLGNDPCERCLENQSYGYVPLDFEYKSAMTEEGILKPLAHTHCQCDIDYNREEVEEAYKTGRLELWNGG